MTLLFSNNAETRITSALTANAADNQIYVIPTHGSRFNQSASATTPERVTLTDGSFFETVEIIGWAGDVATVTRAVEGTLLAWDVGTLFSARITGGVLRMFTQGATAAAGISHVIPDGTATLDMSAAYPDLATMPNTVFVAPGSATTVTITLPATTGANASDVVVVHAGKTDSGTRRVNIAVPAGESLNGTVNGTDYMLNSRSIMALGHNGAWVLGFI